MIDFFTLLTRQNVLSVAVLICYSIIFSFTCISLIIIPRRYNKNSKQKSVSSQLDKSIVPPVTILRPLKGIDTNLYKNLESSFMQDYPQFEVIFVVKDSNDDAIHVVKRLQRAYPNVDSSLIIGDCNDVGVNPKVNNLVQGYNKAKYDIIWIADSNVSVDEGCCGRSVDELCKDRVGLVHHLPIGIDATSFGSRLEMAFLNIVHAKMYVAINWLAPASCIIGKSNMFRKSDLADVGGLKYFGKYMSEDNFIALHLWNKGLKHRMTTDCAYQSLGSNNTKDFLNRRSRWGRVRKYAVPAATLIEPITESLVLGLCFSLALRHFFGFNVYLTLILHFLFWFTSDYLILKTFNPLEVNAIEFWLSWLFREITALPVYCFAISGSCVNWRGKTFHLLSDGTVTLKVEKS